MIDDWDPADRNDRDLEWPPARWTIHPWLVGLLTVLVIVFWAGMIWLGWWLGRRLG